VQGKIAGLFAARSRSLAFVSELSPSFIIHSFFKMGRLLFLHTGILAEKYEAVDKLYLKYSFLKKSKHLTVLIFYLLACLFHFSNPTKASAQ